MVSVLDSVTEGPGFRSQLRRYRVTVLGKLFTPIVPLVAALLRVACVTTGQAESNGSLPSGLWFTSPAGWLPRTGISSETPRSVIEYRLPLPFTPYVHGMMTTNTVTYYNHTRVATTHHARRGIAGADWLLTLCRELAKARRAQLQIGRVRRDWRETTPTIAVPLTTPSHCHGPTSRRNCK